MRIGIVAPEFPPDIGGMQTYAFEFSRELANRGHEVHVFTKPHPEGEITIPGIRVIPVLAGWRRRDRRILTEYRIDVWHVMNAAYGWLALETSPVIISVHGNDFLRPYIPVERLGLSHWPGLWRSKKWVPAIESALARWLTLRTVRKALPKATHIIANSRYTEKVFLERYPACRGKTSAGMVGVSQDYLEVAYDPPHRQKASLVTVARLAEPRKNVDLVLRALAGLKEKYDFTYTIVGDGGLRPALESLSMELGLSGRVRFTGFVSHDELKIILGRSDLFILVSSIIPGSHEGFGIAYLEANACGAPVLAARLAGAAEAVSEGVSGMFVDEITVPAVGMALDRFLNGQIAFETSACRDFARQFTWKKVVDHAIGSYQPQPHTTELADRIP